VEVEIRGAAQLRELAKRLRGAAKDLRSELYRGINRAAKPLKNDVKKSARDRLPHRGGLAKRVSLTKIATKRRMSGNSAGVRLVGTSGYDIGSINRGRVRHLTYGHKPWVNQIVTPGFWTDPLIEGGPKVRDEIQDVMDTVAKKLGGG
jgi:hypothetical protein